MVQSEQVRSTAALMKFHQENVEIIWTHRKLKSALAKFEKEHLETIIKHKELIAEAEYFTMKNNNP